MVEVKVQIVKVSNVMEYLDLKSITDLEVVEKFITLLVKSVGKAADKATKELNEEYDSSKLAESDKLVKYYGDMLKAIIEKIANKYPNIRKKASYQIYEDAFKMYSAPIKWNALGVSLSAQQVDLEVGMPGKTIYFKDVEQFREDVITHLEQEIFTIIIGLESRVEGKNIPLLIGMDNLTLAGDDERNYTLTYKKSEDVFKQKDGSFDNKARIAHKSYWGYDTYLAEDKEGNIEEVAGLLMETSEGLFMYVMDKGSKYTKM